MEHTENSKTTFHICIYAHFFTDRAIFCVKLTQIYEIYTNLLDEEASWSKSQITKHIYTLFSMDDRWKLPKRDVTVYREGLLYKCQTGKIRNWGNGQNVVKLIHILWIWVSGTLLIQTSVDLTFREFLWIFVNLSFRYAPMEHTEKHKSQIVFTQMHIFSPAWAKNLHKFVHIYTNYV